MNLKEFKEKIVEAKEELKYTYRNIGTGKTETGYSGVCIALDCGLDDVFAEVFRPTRGKGCKHAYWLGDLNEENLPLREDFLKAFELYCIQTEAYKEF
jgi:hypothetical protein